MLEKLFRKKDTDKKKTNEDVYSRQVARNKYDFEHVRKIGNPNAFLKEHFLDENYERFLAYVLDFLGEFEAPCLDNFELDITPDELKMLGGGKAYEKSILFEEENYRQYAISETPVLSAIIKTRGIPNRERITNLMINTPDVWQFNHVSYEDKYIYFFECYLKKVEEFFKSPNSYDFEVLRFHPMLYQFLCDHFDEVFKVTIEPENVKGEEVLAKYIELTNLGKDLMEHSNKLSKILKEERDYSYFC